LTVRGKISKRIDLGQSWIYRLTVQKKMAAMLKKLEGVKGLSEHERLLFARSLSATPQERWEMHENFLRSYNLFKRSDQKRFGFK
jgi:hypothetical protein